MPEIDNPFRCPPGRHALFRFVSIFAGTLWITAGIAQRAPEAFKPATVPPLRGIAHVAIRVKDMDASLDFYHKLGFERPFEIKSGDVTTEAFLKINDRQFIELYPADERNPQPGFLHLCFEGDDLNLLHDAYVAEGLTPIAVRKAGAGNLLFTLQGPLQYEVQQNIEYTQYMPGSRHSSDFGQHLGPDRVGDRMVVVAVAMQDPAAARAFYVEKLGFNQSKENPGRLNLPGSSGEQVEIVPATELGAHSSILLSTPDLNKAEAQLKRQQVAYRRAGSKTTDGTSNPRTVDMIGVADPDGNIIRIEQR